MTQKLITMTEKELSRYEIIKNLIDKKINGTDAAKQLSLPVRQVKNIKVKVKKYGVKGIIHANRGKSSNRRMSEEKIDKIKLLIKKEYSDFGPTFTSEKLYENHNLNISRETLRSLMIKYISYRFSSKDVMPSQVVLS